MSADELAAAVAELGALPMPVVPKPQADPVAAGRRLDLLALMDERAASVVSPCLAAVLDEAERLRAQIAGLEAERHSTNEALDDAVQALRAVPKTVFRASRDSIVMGLYDNRQAAMDHVHATLGSEEGGDVTARVIWRADDPEADEPTWECWLFDADMADDSPTGYLVEPLEVASAHDPDADE